MAGGTVSGLTAGVEYHATTDVGWVGRELTTILSGAPHEALSFGRVRLGVEASGSAFATDGLTRFSRDVHGDGSGAAVVQNAATSGFDLRLEITDRAAHVTARWRPGRREQVLARVLRARQRLLLAQALVHYPVLWQAGVGGGVPLAACVLAVNGKGVLLTGPSGVGKSTLVAQEIAVGATAISDNLVVVCPVAHKPTSYVAHGVVEPLRADFSQLPPDVATPIPGRRTTHGRDEGHLNRRADAVSVDLIVLLRRTGGPPGVSAVDPSAAARELAATTYTAGELRRYWPLAAALAVATGHGPVHPEITSTARDLCSSVPCVELDLGPRPAARLGHILSDLESAPAWT